MNGNNNRVALGAKGLAALYFVLWGCNPNACQPSTPCPTPGEGECAPTQECLTAAACFEHARDSGYWRWTGEPDAGLGDSDAGPGDDGYVDSELAWWGPEGRCWMESVEAARDCTTQCTMTLEGFLNEGFCSFFENAGVDPGPCDCP